jgi:DNA modification methylase
MKDFIKCNNCDFKGLIEIGEDSCPQCKTEGMLSWVDERFQEVEDNFDIDSVINIGNGTLINGDNIEIMKKYGDNYFDNCISDFPYDLNFMGKKWDTYNNFYEWNKERAKGLYRIIKPGGYVMIFGHHKTNHRMKCAFEDVGFKIVEEIDWVYATGFPKNQDIGKLFDKDAKAERKVIGESKRHNSKSFGEGNGEDNIYGSFKGGIPMETAPATELANEWDGWKTSGLKPAKEIITVFQKPLDGKYIDNIKKYGCGCMNIDACRIPISQDDIEMLNNKSSKNPTTNYSDKEGKIYGKYAEDKAMPPNELGRFPANVTFDTYMGNKLDKQSGISKSTGGSGEKSHGGMGDNGIYGQYNKEKAVISNLGGLGDEGGASRYFLNVDEEFTPFLYCPKPTKKEKGDYCKHVTVKPKN